MQQSDLLSRNKVLNISKSLCREVRMIYIVKYSKLNRGVLRSQSPYAQSVKSKFVLYRIVLKPYHKVLSIAIPQSLLHSQTTKSRCILCREVLIPQSPEQLCRYGWIRMMTGVHDINTQPFGTRQTKVQDKEKVETNTGSICGGLWSKDRWQIYSSTWRGRNGKEDAFGGPDLHNSTSAKICYNRHCSQGEIL